MKTIGKTRQERRDPGKPRGILRHRPGAGDFHHARIGPCPALADLVQHFWIVRWDLRGHPSQRRQVLPHPNVHLVLQPRQSHLVGVQTGRFSRTLEGRDGVFGIKFRPGGFRPFWQRPVIELRDRELPAQALFGDAIAPLEKALFATGDDAAMVAVAERFLLERRPAADPQADRAGDIVDGIAEDRTLLGSSKYWRAGTCPREACSGFSANTSASAPNGSSIATACTRRSSAWTTANRSTGFNWRWTWAISTRPTSSATSRP